MPREAFECGGLALVERLVDGKKGPNGVRRILHRNSLGRDPGCWKGSNGCLDEDRS